MLDNLSRGRFQLGVGRGISTFEVGHFGIPHTKIRSLYDEALEVVLKGLGCEVLDHDGRHYHYANFPMELRPVQKPHPPLWYGTGSPGSAPSPIRSSGSD